MIDSGYSVMGIVKNTSTRNQIPRNLVGAMEWFAIQGVDEDIVESEAAAVVAAPRLPLPNVFH